jgi:hypothetical protein
VPARLTNHEALQTFARCLAGCLLLAVLADVALGADAPLNDMPSLGAHTLLTQADGQGRTIAVSSPIDTQPNDSSLLVLVGGYTNNAEGPTDNYANKWTQRGPSVAYNGYEGRFNARAYVAERGRGGAQHVIRLAKSGTPAGEITAPFIEIRHAGKLQDVAQSYPTPGVFERANAKLARIWHADTPEDRLDATVNLASASVTTTGPATLVAVWWGDGRMLNMKAVPGDGFQVIERYVDLPPDSGVQCAVAVRQVAGPGTYHVTWTVTPAQGAILWLFAFQSARKPDKAG